MGTQWPMYPQVLKCEWLFSDPSNLHLGGGVQLYPLAKGLFQMTLLTVYTPRGGGTWDPHLRSQRLSSTCCRQLRRNGTRTPGGLECL